VKRRELDDDGDRKLDDAVLPEFFEILSRLTHELGRPEIIKSPEKNRVRLVLEALWSAKTLLILDNLETVLKADRDKLFGLIKYLPQGCKAILSSRRHIGSSADTLMLGRLEEAAALRFLADLALQNPLLARSTWAERLRLYQVTNGIPLLLRWTSGQLGRGDCRTLNTRWRSYVVVRPKMIRWSSYLAISLTISR